MAIIQYPGTNFHDLNLDWVLEQVKNLLTEWGETRTDWENLLADNTEFKSTIENEWADFREYIITHIDETVPAEVAAEIERMADDGRLLAIITADPTGEGSALSDAVSLWMNGHITQEQGYVLDDRLIETTMAAQAKATGDAINAVKDALNQLETAIPAYRNLVNNILLNMVRNNADGVVSNPWSAQNYVAAECDVVPNSKITVNGEWCNNSFGMFADSEGNVIGRIDTYRDPSTSAYVYNVPAGAAKAYFSYNALENQTYLTRGFVVFEGNMNISSDDFTIAKYGYDKQGAGVFLNKLRALDGNTFDQIQATNNQRLTSLESNARELIVDKNGSGDFTKIIDAINYVYSNNLFDAVVRILAGTWDIIDELGNDYMNAVSSNSSTWGIVLKNRIHLIGSSNSVLVAKYTGSNTNVKQYFSLFNAGEYGFTLENLNMETDNTRYTIHDDRGASGLEQYINKYINCSMKHTNGMYSDCIGGGLGRNGLIVIENCYFEGDNDRLAYYHGNNYGGQTDAQCKIIVNGNYFAGIGTFKLTKYGDSVKMSTAYVSNNSFGTAPSVNSGSYAPQDNMRMIEWNNEIRP